MSVEPALHRELEPLAFLLGTWKGKGAGSYPGIDDFEYLEVAAFSHVGKSFIAYAQRTRDASTGGPLHSETGYLRPVGLGRAEFVVVQPTGLVELHDVEIRETTLVMASTTVVRTATAKPTESVMRRVVVEANVMNYTVEMAAMGHPLQHHLQAALERS